MVHVWSLVSLPTIRRAAYPPGLAPVHSAGARRFVGPLFADTAAIPALSCLRKGTAPTSALCHSLVSSRPHAGSAWSKERDRCSTRTRRTPQQLASTQSWARCSRLASVPTDSRPRNFAGLSERGLPSRSASARSANSSPDASGYVSTRLHHELHHDLGWRAPVALAPVHVHDLQRAGRVRVMAPLT